jgi:isopentenyl phosphate kinase
MGSNIIIQKQRSVVGVI